MADTAPSTTPSAKTCIGEGCGKPAKMHCPTCLKNGISSSTFCTQDCFKTNWATHKLMHPAAPAAPYNPYPDYPYTGKMRPYPLTPMRTVPDHIPRPDYAVTGIPQSELSQRGNITAPQLNQKQIEKMRTVGRLTREVLDIAAAAVRPGVTHDEIDRIVHEATIARNAYPSPLNYNGFPKSCCISVNEVICHGIPDLRPLEEGDIVNLDISVYYDGVHGDANETVFVGKVDSESQKLVRTTYECLQKAIEIVKPGVPYREIGNVISKHAHQAGFSVVRSYCGHGVGELFHGPPSVPHYAKSKAPGVMKVGHCFTIEPMINAGVYKDVLWRDNWTSTTADGKRSAQFESVLLVTETGCEVLTARKEAGGLPHFMTQGQLENGSSSSASTSTATSS